MVESYLEQLPILKIDILFLKNLMIERWQSLLDQIEIIETPDGSEFWSQEEFSEFENETGIILPVEYKEFCQVFGTGEFSSFIGIYCPNLQFSNFCLKAIKDQLAELPNSRHGRIIDREALIKLFNSAFVFGSEPSSISIFWDLRSYKEVDDSYDIYWASSDSFNGDIYKLGRDFYEFISEFCLGTKSYEILPEKEWRPQESLQRTFTRVRPNWDLLDPYLE